jgi:NADH:ubiquinone oxidoreductase subunit 5 (subunit L)/multisubunit Na+/H+ antiporter MnhA subunit
MPDSLNNVRFIILSLTLGIYNLIIVHLLIHSAFKRLLFVNVGCVLHVSYSEQFINNITRSTNSHILSSRLLIALLSLNGMFFISGIISKDVIVETIMLIRSSMSIFLVLVYYILRTGQNTY